jgi:hypothetical protein
LITVGEEEALCIPPPGKAAFAVKVQLVTVGEEEYSLYIAPPVLPVKVQLITVGDEDELDIPPPEEAVLAVKMQLVTVGEEEEVLYIPPPE